MANKLESYARLIEQDLEQYSKYINDTAAQQYGDSGKLITRSFTDFLQRPAKRLRGSLVMIGYELCGGKDTKMIIQAARAIEMLHAYFLIIDDIQDNSDFRRGKPSLHKELEEYHKSRHLKGDSASFGRSMAMNAAGIGNHAAQTILANLQANRELKLNILSITNRTSLITYQGQTLELLLSASDDLPDEDEIIRTMYLKTANYSFINPLHVGMVLAGADCHDTDVITEFATKSGIVYQLLNDYKGIFEDSKNNDITEGKPSLYLYYTIKNANKKDRDFIKNVLNRPISSQDLKGARNIVKNNGVAPTFEYWTTIMSQAESSLSTVPGSWQKGAIEKLESIVQNMRTPKLAK